MNNEKLLKIQNNKNIEKIRTIKNKIKNGIRERICNWVEECGYNLNLTSR